MILRDTSIREPSSSSSIKDSQSSSYFRGSSYNTNNSSFNSYSSREPDCSSISISPFSGSNGSNNLSSSFAISNNNGNNGQFSLGSKESSSVILRDNNATTVQHSSPRVASNRFLSSGLDTQRIIKQSSEDCRRLLQQVS